METKVVREWLDRVGATTLFIEPDSPWENGYCESFNVNECLSACRPRHQLSDLRLGEMLRYHYRDAA